MRGGRGCLHVRLLGCRHSCHYGTNIKASMRLVILPRKAAKSPLLEREPPTDASEYHLVGTYISVVAREA